MTRRQLSLETRRELIQAIAEGYRTATRADKRKILDEFTEVTGFHRMHAIRALRQRGRLETAGEVRSSLLRWVKRDPAIGKQAGIIRSESGGLTIRVQCSGPYLNIFTASDNRQLCVSRHIELREELFTFSDKG